VSRHRVLHQEAIIFPQSNFSTAVQLGIDPNNGSSMNATFEWNPEPKLLEQVRQLAQQRGQSLDIILSEAVNLYLELQTIESVSDVPDPLIGLFRALRI
jgi:predicted P-loop ATPase/GTPase